jgi:RNA polymerase sigma-70 factor (ECF subfamily)
MMGMRTDAMVISASIGDPERFGALFDRHATVLYRYFVRRVGAGDADQLVGEVFRVAFERRTTYDLDRPDARPWLYGIATRLLSRHHRSEGRRLRATARLLAERSRHDDLVERVAAMVDASEAWPAVAERIAALPAGERDVLLLYAWEELSYEHVAAALDIPIGTVRSRLNRARKRLREPEAGRRERTHD